MDWTTIFPSAALLGAAVSAGCLPGAAAAQALQPASEIIFSNAKTEAILGGAPSQLAAILARQNAPHPAIGLQPMSYSAPAVFPSDGSGTRRASPAHSGRPDVFGSVALAVARSPLDRRWRQVRALNLGRTQAAYAVSLRGRPELDRIDAINRYVNRRVKFVNDTQQFGRADHWSTAGDTLRRGRGDCEDYAIAKLQLLRAAGMADRNLYLSIVRDLVRRSDHAVLVVRAAGRMLVLDNGTDRTMDSDDVRDYRPVLTFAAGGTWTHGYRRSRASVLMAAATTASLTPSAR